MKLNQIYNKSKFLIIISWKQIFPKRDTILFIIITQYKENTVILKFVETIFLVYNLIVF